MKSFSFEELSELAQQNAINLYYADSDYQAFIEKVRKSNPDECPMVGDWAQENGIRFNEIGERIA